MLGLLSSWFLWWGRIFGFDGFNNSGFRATLRLLYRDVLSCSRVPTTLIRHEDYPMATDMTDVWQCPCGGNLFLLRRDGTTFCNDCESIVPEFRSEDAPRLTDEEQEKRLHLVEMLVPHYRDKIGSLIDAANLLQGYISGCRR
jgi:hypothetical protein